jgi:hypothetical protein
MKPAIQHTTRVRRHLIAPLKSRRSQKFTSGEKLQASRDMQPFPFALGRKTFLLQKVPFEGHSGNNRRSNFHPEIRNQPFHSRRN